LYNKIVLAFFHLAGKNPVLVSINTYYSKIRNRENNLIRWKQNFSDFIKRNIYPINMIKYRKNPPSKNANNPNSSTGNLKIFGMAW
jgi:hypothetical protein